MENNSNLEQKLVELEQQVMELKKIVQQLVQPVPSINSVLLQKSCKICGLNNYGNTINYNCLYLNCHSRTTIAEPAVYLNLSKELA